MLPGPAPTPIDAFCSERGDTNASPYVLAESLIKNNFCVSNWPPKRMKVSDMRELDKHLPKPGSASGDRLVFRKLDEGHTVEVQGFVLTARQVDGEAANCGRAVPPGRDYSDIQIPLVEERENDECRSVMVVMSPHYRPAAWNPSVLKRLAGSGLRVRVTGQLFFDSTYRTCGGVSKSQRMVGEARISRAQVHPILKFEVCPSGKCSDNYGWVPLESFGSAPAKY
jgi:hypothetical protein